MTDLTHAQIDAATDRLVAAFAATDAAGYFGCFDPAATFVFPDVAERLADRAAYEALWAGWVADGWRVESCESTSRHVQVHGDTAVLTHAVRTVTSVGDTRTTTHERETIVYALDAAGAVVAIHEHLSTTPGHEGTE